MNPFLSIWLFLGLIFGSAEEYRIEVIHPGISRTSPVSCTLSRVSVDHHNSSLFLMEVESVVCGKTLCKIVPVKLFWDELGTYDHFELAPGVALEKDKGKYFTRSDYEKLHRILADPLSPFSFLNPEQIVSYEEDESSVDGITGSTLLVDTSASVPGAVLTCFTLWHWVNGEAGDEIRRITGTESSLEELRALLNNKEARYRVFALEQLYRRSDFDRESLTAVANMALHEDLPLFGKAVRFLEAAPKEDYFSIMEELFSKAETSGRILILGSLLNSLDNPDLGYYDRLSTQISSCESFQEVDLMLKLMDAKNPESRVVIRSCMGLLERDILIARRAYWFLEGADLTDNQRMKVDSFRKNHSEYL